MCTYCHGRGRVGPSELGDDGAARELLLPLPIRLDRDIVAENGARIVELAFLMAVSDIATFSGMAKTPQRVGVRSLFSTASHLL